MSLKYILEKNPNPLLKLNYMLKRSKIKNDILFINSKSINESTDDAIKNIYNITYSNQHIQNNIKFINQKIKNVVELDFTNFYANLLFTFHIPNEIPHETHNPSHTTAKLHYIDDGDNRYWRWDIMLKFYKDYKILKTLYVEKDYSYRPFAWEYLKLAKTNKDFKKHFVSVWGGLFFYGRKQDKKEWHNFLGGSYMYAIGYNIIHSLVRSLIAQKCQIIQTATDSVIFVLPPQTPLNSIKLNLPLSLPYHITEYKTFHYFGQGHYEAKTKNNQTKQKHQGVHY